MKGKKSSGLNKKLLNQMTASAMPEGPPKPTLHLSGKEAKAVHRLKPGSKVKMTVHGKVTSLGLRQWGPDKGAPEADVEIHRMRMHGKKKNDVGETESKAEDAAEGGVEEP